MFVTFAVSKFNAWLKLDAVQSIPDMSVTFAVSKFNSWLKLDAP